MWKNKTDSIPDGFKIIPNFSRYAINTEGHVFSLIRNRLKKIWVNYHGYLAVGIQNDSGKTRTIPVHRLVMETFIGPRPEGLEICHNDGNKQNPILSNLRYDTHQANCSERKERYGERVQTAKLTIEQVIEIKKLYTPAYKRKSNSKELAQKFGVSQEAIVNIVNGRTWAKALEAMSGEPTSKTGEL